MLHETEMKIIVELKRRLGGGYDVRGHETVKTNSNKKRGIVIRKCSEEISPVIYIDDILEHIHTGNITISGAVDFIIRIFRDETQKISLKPSDIFGAGKENFLRHIFPEAISVQWNGELLKTAPHKKLLDIAIIYRYKLNVSGDFAGSFIITNDICNLVGLSFSDLDLAVQKNVIYKNPYCIKKLEDLVCELFPTSVSKLLHTDSSLSTYVITNKDYCYGASVLAFPEIFKELVGITHSNLIILPSSIHEVLVIPESETDNANTILFFKKMVEIVNSTDVDPEEVLSKNIYRYSYQSGKIEVL